VFKDFKRLYPISKEDLLNMCVLYRINLEKLSEGEDVVFDPREFIWDYCEHALGMHEKDISIFIKKDHVQASR
jgi:hypothetical protein